MQHRYAQPEDENEGFEQADLLTEDHYFTNKKIEEGQEMTSRQLPKKKGRFQITEKPKIKLAPLGLVPLATRYNRNSQKYLKSMSLQKTNYQEPLILPPTKEAPKMGEYMAGSLQEVIETAIIKTKRTQVGQELIIRTDENQQLNRANETPPTANFLFKKTPPKSTHEAFREMSRFASSSFVSSKYNSLLRSKLQKCQGKARQIVGKALEDILFEGGEQSCNLQSVWQEGEGVYNVMLSVDTNTKGHQSWFYFHITNNSPHRKSLIINICNMKRRFPMVQNGQGVYCKRANHQWSIIKEVFVENIEKGKHKLSFQLQLGESEQVSVSLLPPYTYSQQLQIIQSYQVSPHVKVQILTYSLAGLAIPLITITKNARSQASKNRDLYLITARIHPSETCSSFIANALIQQLIKPHNQDFLRHTVIKVVPMVNPDGVVFGNFRTNYLGNDLNRSFNSNDEAVFPEIVALKELGQKCKQEYGGRFMGLLDLHGHSTQPNSFIYGPEHPQNSEYYLECRILAKILDRVSAFFRYDSSSFRLEEYKNNTARGYFFRKLKVPAYTIETSYALYCPKGGQDGFRSLGLKQWEQLGRNIVDTLKISHECQLVNQENKQNEKNNKRRAQSNSKIEQYAVFVRLSLTKTEYAKFKQDILQEIKNEPHVLKQQANIDKSGESESDGEGEQEDLSFEERSLIIRCLGERERGKSMLPRVAKEGAVAVPALSSNSYSPSLIPTFYIGSDGREGALQRIYSKLRNNRRYNRPVSISQEYTQYLLRNITGMTSLKPQVASFNPTIRRPGLGRQGM